jgi:ribosomal protein S18 acetylase RimI-like enzyme
MSVRPCEEKDLPEVVGLITQLAEVSNYDKEFQLNEFSRIFRKMAALPEVYENYVYESNGKVAGFISVVFYMTYFHRVGTAQVNELVVDDNFRGQGIGQALMKAAEQEARRRGMDELEVGTEQENLPAQQFYRKYGFDEEYILFGMEFEK